MLKLTTRMSFLVLGMLAVLAAGLLFHQHLMYRLVSGKYIDPYSRYKMEQYVSHGDCSSMMVLLKDASFRDDGRDVIKYSIMGAPYCGRASLIVAKYYLNKALTCNAAVKKDLFLKKSIEYAKNAVHKSKSDNNYDTDISDMVADDGNKIINGSYKFKPSDNFAIFDNQGCSGL